MIINQIDFKTQPCSSGQSGLSKIFISSVTKQESFVNSHILSKNTYLAAFSQINQASGLRDVEQIVRKKILNRTRGRVTRPQVEQERKKPVSKPSRVISINSEAQVPSNSNINSNKTLNKNVADILYFNYQECYAGKAGNMPDCAAV